MSTYQVINIYQNCSTRHITFARVNPDPDIIEQVGLPAASFHLFLTEADEDYDRYSLLQKYTLEPFVEEE